MRTKPTTRNMPRKQVRWFAQTAWVALWLLFVLTAQAGYKTAYRLSSATYSAAEGGTITGTVTRYAVLTTCTFDCDWFPEQSSMCCLGLSSGGTYPIWVSDLPANWQDGVECVSFGPYQYTANFSLPFTQNSDPYYDRTGTLSIGGGLVDPTQIQEATITLLDDDQVVGVGYWQDGCLYAGDWQLFVGGTGGRNHVTIRFFRDVAVSQRTISYALSGNAIAGTDYTPSIGTVTFAQGSYYADVTITANNVSQTVNKTLTITLTANPAYQRHPDATVANITIYPNYPTVGIISDSTIFEGGSAGGFVISRYPAWTVSPAKQVNFSVGGTAANGSDYTPALTTSVTIPAGSADVLFTVTPSLTICRNLKHPKPSL